MLNIKYPDQKKHGFYFTDRQSRALSADTAAASAAKPSQPLAMGDKRNNPAKYYTTRKHSHSITLFCILQPGLAFTDKSSSLKLISDHNL